MSAAASAAAPAAMPAGGAPADAEDAVDAVEGPTVGPGVSDRAPAPVGAEFHEALTVGNGPSAVHAVHFPGALVLARALAGAVHDRDPMAVSVLILRIHALGWTARCSYREGSGFTLDSTAHPAVIGLPEVLSDAKPAGWAYASKVADLALFLPALWALAARAGPDAPAGRWAFAEFAKQAARWAPLFRPPAPMRGCYVMRPKFAPGADGRPADYPVRFSCCFIPRAAALRGAEAWWPGKPARHRRLRRHIDDSSPAHCMAVVVIAPGGRPGRSLVSPSRLVAHRGVTGRVPFELYDDELTLTVVEGCRGDFARADAFSSPAALTRSLIRSLSAKLATDARPCDSCEHTPPRPLICSGCGRAAYCDAECQAADWARHKPVCLEARAAVPDMVRAGEAHRRRLLAAFAPRPREPQPDTPFSNWGCGGRWRPGAGTWGLEPPARGEPPEDAEVPS